MNKKIITFARTALSILLFGWMSACTGASAPELPPSVPEGTPITVLATIGASAPHASSTRALAASNSYDRTEFVTADKINVICNRGSLQMASAGYECNGTAWAVAAGNNALGFLPNVSYRAEFPVGYDRILADQKSEANFLKSNYLLTPSVPVSGAEVNFTGANAFAHQNAKLTLKFLGTNTLPEFSQLTVQATGLLTGGSAVENVSMLRPVASAYTWCAVVYPCASGQSRSVTVSVTDKNGVTYRATITSALQKGNSYTHTLTLKNDILVPSGQDIEDWNVESRYNGDFDEDI